MLKSPRGCGPSAPSFSRRQRREVSESRGPSGRDLPILAGTAPCATAGGAGDSALATSAPNRGHRGSLPPSPNGDQRNRKVVKEKGKGEQGKGESSRRRNARHVSVEGERPPLLPLANSASKAGQGRLGPLWPEDLPESSPRPREGHLAKDGPGLGGQVLGERGRKPPASLTEHKQQGEALHFALPPSPSGEMGRLKGSGAPKDRFSNKDKGRRTQPELSGGNKLPTSPAPTGRKAALPRVPRPETKAAPPERKRPETHPEAGQEAWLKSRGNLGRNMLEVVQVFHVLAKKKEDVAAAVRTPQGITEIQERPTAPAGALPTVPEDLRLPPLPSPSRAVDQVNGLGASKASVLQVDRGMPGQGKLRPDKASADCGAEAEEEGAVTRKKRGKDHPEASQEDGRKHRSSGSSHRLESGKKNHKLSGQTKIQDGRPTTEISEPVEDLEEAVAKILEAVRLPPLLSPLREEEQPKGLGATKVSVVQVDKGMQVQDKLCPDKAPAACGAEGEEEAAVGKSQHKRKHKHKSKSKRHDPESTQKDGRKLQSSGSSHRLESGKKNDKLSGQSKIQDGQPATEISGRVEAPDEALAKILEAMRLPPLLSPLREVEQPKGLRATKVSVVQVDKGIQVQGKLCPDKALADCGAQGEEEGAVPRKKRRKDHPEPNQEDGRKHRSSGSSHRLESGKNNHKLSVQSSIQDRQPTTEISGRLEASEKALAIAREALRLPPLLSPLREVEQPKGLGSSKASVVQVDKGMQGQGKLCPDKAPAACGAGAEEEGAVSGKTRGKDHPEPSQENGRKIRSSHSSHRLDSGQKNDKLSGHSKVQGLQQTTKISGRVEEPAGASGTAPVALRLPPLLSLSWKVDTPKGPGAPKDSRDQMDREPRLPRKCSPEKKRPECSAQPGQKAPLPGGQKQLSPEAGKKDRGGPGRRLPESVQELHALGKREDRRAGAVRAPQPPAQAHVRLPAPAAIWDTAPEASRFPTAHFPSRSVEQPKDSRNTEARGRQADRGLRGPPKPWRGRGPSESGAEPQEEAAPLTNKRKRSPPEPSPQVWKKLRTFLSANMPEAPQKKDKLAGSFGVPRSSPKARERGGTTAEGSAPRETQAGFCATARDRSWKAQDKWAHPFPTGPAQRVPRARWSPAPPRRWRHERERLKRKAQRERELAAKYTALGKRNFFEERQKDMEIASRYGYMV